MAIWPAISSSSQWRSASETPCALLTLLPVWEATNSSWVCGGLRSADDMVAILERLQAALAQASLHSGTHDPLAEMDVTVSIGTATGRGTEVTPGALLHAADRSMYCQKSRLP